MSALTYIKIVRWSELFSEALVNLLDAYYESGKLVTGKEAYLNIGNCRVVNDLYSELELLLPKNTWQSKTVIVHDNAVDYNTEHIILDKTKLNRIINLLLKRCKKNYNYVPILTHEELSEADLLYAVKTLIGTVFTAYEQPESVFLTTTHVTNKQLPEYILTNITQQLEKYSLI